MNRGGRRSGGGPGARPAFGHRPRELRGVLSRVLTELGLDEATGVVRIAQSWERAVGPVVAAHCQPVRLRGAVLEARVDSSAWCQQLMLQRPALLEALRRELGEEAPTELRLYVRSGRAGTESGGGGR